MSTPTKHLDFHGLHTHLWECHVGIVELSLTQPALRTVVIRGEDGDRYLAAIHREGDVLVFDLGQKVDGDARD